MLPLPNMAIYEIENKVDLFICFHFYSAMIGIREKLQLRMPFSAFFVDHAHHGNRLRVGNDPVLHSLEEIRWREIPIHEFDRAGRCAISGLSMQLTPIS